MTKTVVAVLWDFAWTLIAPEPAGRWLASGLAEAGVRVPAEEQAAWAAKAAGAGFPGPATPRGEADQLAAWRHRALGPEIHEAVYRGLLERAGLPWPQAAQALYHRHMAADGWERYPDAVHVLKRLTAAGVACGGVSNIGWDIRFPLAAAGLLPYWARSCAPTRRVSASRIRRCSPSPASAWASPRSGP